MKMDDNSDGSSGSGMDDESNGISSMLPFNLQPTEMTQ